jgi:uncharacterized protein YutE (UPF0331/DUF86 family)
VIREVLDEATRSPKVALLLLADALIKQMRRLLATSGHSYRTQNDLAGLAANVSVAANLPHGFLEAVRQFALIRNLIVHGSRPVSDDEVLRAIDSGVTILRWLQAVPREVNIVYDPGVEVFADKDCQVRRQGVKGVILETTSPGGAVKTHRIFPTTRRHFTKGMQVTWEWNQQAQWGESWFRDPDTGEVKQAWLGSMEFIGKNADEV